MVLYFDTPTVDDLREVGDIGGEFLDASRRGLAMLVIVEEDVGLLGADERAELERQYQEHGSRMIATAQVIEETGFTGAAIRSAFQAINLLTGRSRKLRVFSSVDDAIRWLGRTYAGCPPREKIEEGVASLRACRRPA